MALNSAPAVLLTPAVFMESTSCMSTPDVFQREVYPWVASTPEPSPMLPSLSPEFPAQLVLPADFIRTVCNPYFEEIQCCVQQKQAAPMVSSEMLRVKCEPFFEKMIVALQQAVHRTQGHVNTVQTMQAMSQTDAIAYLPAAFHQSTPFLRLDEESTEADDSSPFASIFSVSSEGEGLDCIECMSDAVPSSIANGNSEPADDAEKSTMVCRHWKTKGWCRLESNCKFLHLEHKRGVSAANGDKKDKCMVPPATSAGRKKRSGQKRPIKEQTLQLGNDAQLRFQQTMHFPCMPPAPDMWLEAGARCAR